MTWGAGTLYLWRKDDNLFFSRQQCVCTHSMADKSWNILTRLQALDLGSAIFCAKYNGNCLSLILPNSYYELRNDPGNVFSVPSCKQAQEGEHKKARLRFDHWFALTTTAVRRSMQQSMPLPHDASPSLPHPRWVQQHAYPPGWHWQ